MLRRLVADFSVIPSAVDEQLDAGPLATAVARLAERKARAVASSLGAGVVLGADTIVAIDGDALGKPVDPADARAMLTRLRGRSHEVLTGVAVIAVAGGRAWSATEVSRVVMARYPEEVIDDYVASGSPLDKAGGYAVQELGGALVDGVIGSYTNVIGLPLRLTARLLIEAGVSVTGPAWS